jgi:hypothetical protein
VRAGAGLQRSFTWGGLFAELVLTVGEDGSEAPRFLFPAAIQFLGGYRYILVKG